MWLRMWLWGSMDDLENAVSHGEASQSKGPMVVLMVLGLVVFVVFASSCRIFRERRQGSD